MSATGSGGGVAKPPGTSDRSGFEDEPEHTRTRTPESEAGRGTDDGARPFWETKPLAAMSEAEWESLCDGCGRCCLQKLEDEDTGEVHFTRVACHMLDIRTCRCRDYARRRRHVEDCLSVRPLTDEKRAWLPSSCAYRRLDEGRGLADWHPLVSGDPDSVVRAGIAVAGRAVSEREVAGHELVRHLVVWDDEPLLRENEGRTEEEGRD